MDIKDFSMDFFRLDGKTAIVTGGNTGIGQAYAVALAKAGANLFITTYDDNLTDTRQLIEETGSKVEFFKTNLLIKENNKKVIDACVDKYGSIDILVNNAGMIKRAPLLEFQDEDWQMVMELNLNSVYYLCHEAAKIMAKQKSGKIINIASMLSFQGGKFVPPYTASKHGVAGITKAFANELAEFNIQINAIAPGYISTANTAPIQADKKRSEDILSRIPAARWGLPSDLMGTIVFLSSRASDYMNGHILAVDGGWLVR